jgi:hypothetical protein
VEREVKDFKSSAGRLARFFQKSRDRWRAHAAEKQTKLRALETRVRDLERSRSKWRERAQQAEQALRAITEGKPSERPEGGAAEDGEAEVHEGEYLARGEAARARGHGYDLRWVEMALLQLLVGLGSLRGTCRMLGEGGVMGEGGRSPAVSSVRSWLFRIGLYVFQQPVQRRDDWIVILDLTVELGTAKVLAIVGLPQSRLQALSGREQGCCLSHRDVECLALEVLEHSNGEAIAECLERLERRIGRIRQIVADHGSDVKSGIGRYRQRHGGVRFTYDVTHQVALWLEHALKDDDTYRGFRRHCQDSVLALQQTALHFLKPPTPRSKARWQQIDKQVAWARKALVYYDRGQFAELAPGYRLDGWTQEKLRGVLSEAQRYRLNPRVWRDYGDEASYLQALRQHLGEAPVESHRQALCQAGQLGRRQFETHLGWLLNYRAAVDDYARRMEEVKRFQERLKHDGLRAGAADALRQEAASSNAALQALRTHMQAYLKRESAGIGEGEIWLASSDVLESLFGKYKLFSQRSPLKEVSRWVLTLPLLTVKLSRELIRQALESVSTQRMEQWVAEHFGPSAFARRKAAFGSPKKT